MENNINPIRNPVTITGNSNISNGVNYLRFSLTDKCNLNCLYCTPLEKGQFLDRCDVLSYEEMAKAVDLFVRAGIRKLRLTGGEPLIKKDIVDLVKMLRGIKGLEEISMTTNGIFLEDKARSLKEAGLDRINVSLDTLRRQRFEAITGVDGFDKTWAGVKAAMEAGLSPVKLNVILLKGYNDDEALDFASLTLKLPLIVRFIEFFPTNKRSKELSGRRVTTEETKTAIIKGLGELAPVSEINGNGPAEYGRLRACVGAVGFISSFTKDFCRACNRVRVDCTGKVSPCLFSGPVYDMRPFLRDDKKEGQAFEYIKKILGEKQGHKNKNSHNFKTEMSSIGG